MKNRLYRFLPYLMIALLPLLTGCNDEDDVMDIFTGKTWKMSFIAQDGSYQQFDFWGGDEILRRKSMQALEQPENFNLTFEGAEKNGLVQGTFTGNGIAAKITGRWQANGKDNKLQLTNIRVSRTESDPLAKAFVEGLQRAFQYEGDINNLFIYFEVKNQPLKMRIGLKPKR